jgi:hypothetical protein
MTCVIIEAHGRFHEFDLFGHRLIDSKIQALGDAVMSLFRDQVLISRAKLSFVHGSLRSRSCRGGTVGGRDLSIRAELKRKRERQVDAGRHL